MGRGEGARGAEEAGEGLCRRNCGVVTQKGNGNGKGAFEGGFWDLRSKPLGGKGK
jgi:hypothetical protein